MAFGQLNKRCKDGSRRFYEDEISEGARCEQGGPKEPPLPRSYELIGSHTITSISELLTVP